jgi:hypothetical protein
MCSSLRRSGRDFGGKEVRESLLAGGLGEVLGGFGDCFRGGQSDRDDSIFAVEAFATYHHLDGGTDKGRYVIRSHHLPYCPESGLAAHTPGCHLSGFFWDSHDKRELLLLGLVGLLEVSHAYDGVADHGYEILFPLDGLPELSAFGFLIHFSPCGFLYIFCHFFTSRLLANARTGRALDTSSYVMWGI